MKYIVGIDIGTTGAKCGVFNEKGYLLSSAYREYSCEYPNPNWVEQDAVLITNEAFEAAKEALANSGIKASEIYSISLSSQRSIICKVLPRSNFSED